MNIIDIIMRNTFKTANEAYEYMHNEIITNGVEFAGTKALFNIGFTIEDPTNKVITNKERNWNEEYAAAEWAWYLSGDPRVSTLGELYGKIPAIWKRMADKNGEVNSNYGYQWKRNDQLENVINILKQGYDTRQAAISIYDGKEINKYEFDTPCTYAIQFTVVQNKLYMSVYMRSNDLWYGFCNDQYQFASLQEMVAERLNLPVGTYYHHAHNLHLYNDKI
jgi:thymidylate synthase|tara:strand:- start:530 stop:1192 length:663 start_codon:yes stop_codon:yes gene_type:complete